MAKLKAFFLSITFLSYCILSVHAMPDAEIIEEDHVRAFCAKYNFSDLFTNDVYHHVKGKALNVNEHGVPNLDYMAALLFYNQHRVATEFALLFDLFSKTSPEKRQEVWNNLIAQQAYNSAGPSLNEFFYDSAGMIRTSPFQIEGTESLEEKLLALPYSNAL